MTDLLMLLNLIRTLSNQIKAATDLVEKMRAEGRDELTAAELADLQAADDAARDDLATAIARAKAEGR